MPASGTFEARSLWKAPRPLNEPLTCSDSSFSASGAATPSVPAGSSSAGVRRMCGRMRRQAAATSFAATGHMTQEMVEVGRAGARILGGLVVAPQAHGLGMHRIAPEFLDLVGRHRPALQPQAAHRVGRELAEIVRLHGAEIALGRDMQADRLADLGTEALGQPIGAE